MKIKNRSMPYFILFVLFAFLMTGCTGSPTDRNPTQSLRSSGSSETSASTVESRIKYKLFTPHDQMLLIPATASDYFFGKENGIPLYYSISSDGTKWLPITGNSTKIASITGHRYNAAQDSTIDVYQMKIGDWIGYYKYSSEYPKENVECHLLLDNSGSCLEYAQRCKDYAVLQIFDDIYVADTEGTLKMASSRKTGSFDYDTMEKKGIGDLYAWEWTINPVCSLANNRVFYLTSREGQFYSIWMLDIDNGTEKRFGNDIAYQLGGTSSQQLIVNIRDETTGEYKGKMLSTANPESFAAITNGNWQSMNDWMYCVEDVDGRIKLIMKKEERQVEITSEESFHPIYTQGNILELCFFSEKTLQTKYLKLDMNNLVFNTGKTYYMDTPVAWSNLLTELNADSSSFSKASEQGIEIIIK